MTTWRPGSRRTLLAVFVVSAALQYPTWNRSLVSLDEGQLAAIAARIVDGEVLYRDIYTGIYPGVYWLSAALFALFGKDVLVLRAAQVVVNALTATGLFALARPMTGTPLAWVIPFAYACLAAVSFPVFTLLPYSGLSMLAATAAALAGVRYVTTAKPAWGIALGAALAFSVIAKQNYGALALLATFVSALWTRREGALAERSIVQAFTVPVGGGLAVAALAAAVLVAQGAWPSFLESTFSTLFASQMEAFNQPMPPVLGPHPAGDGRFLFFYGPGGLFGAMFHGHAWANAQALSIATRVGYGSAWAALFLLPLVGWRFGVRGAAGQRIAARFAVPFAGLLFLGIFPSAIWSHLAAVYPPLLVILTAAWAAMLHASAPAARRFFAFTGALALAPIVAVCAAVALDVRDSHPIPSRLPHASLLLGERDTTLYDAALAFLRRCEPQERAPVLVAPDMPLLYLSSGRRNPTPYDLIIPGDVRDAVIVDRIDATNVDCIVFNPAMYTQFDRFEVLFPRLHAYMKERFEETGSTSSGGMTWLFLERRKGAAS